MDADIRPHRRVNSATLPYLTPNRLRLRSHGIEKYKQTTAIKFSFLSSFAKDSVVVIPGLGGALNGLNLPGILTKKNNQLNWYNKPWLRIPHYEMTSTLGTK